MDISNKRVHIRIEGRVQGVGFRAFVEDHANRLGLTGWVRNRWDGSVDAAAEGPELDLIEFIKAVEQGPRSGYVSQLQVDWQPASGEFIGFIVRRTD